MKPTRIPAVAGLIACLGCGAPVPPLEPSPYVGGTSEVLVRSEMVESFDEMLHTPEAVVLFEGGSLEGWRVVPGSEAEFAVEGEDLVVRGGPGYLETVETYGDFLLQFEFKTEAADVNSGVFFRAEPGTEDAPSNGYELQICNTIIDGDRSIPGDYGTGWGTGAIFRRQAVEFVNADDGVWNTVSLLAVGNRFRTRVNGVSVCDYSDERPADANPRRGARLEAGHISLQAHDETTAIRFRHIRLVPLETAGG